MNTTPVHDRVAIFSDIHANLPALLAVLQDIDASAITALYCGGDLVGYGPHPDEVCDWTLANTDQRSKDFMRDLPFDLRFAVGGANVRLVHGSPRKVNEYKLVLAA